MLGENDKAIDLHPSFPPPPLFVQLGRASNNRHNARGIALK